MVRNNTTLPHTTYPIALFRGSAVREPFASKRVACRRPACLRMRTIRRCCVRTLGLAPTCRLVCQCIAAAVLALLEASAVAAR